jgi:hypothetical protein
VQTKETKMKKIMIAAGAIALCGAVLADIQSANIVGYSTINAPAAGRYIALGAKFEKVGTEKAFTVNDLITIGKPKGAASFGANCDNIWLWNASANSGLGEWEKYYYHITKKGFCLKGSTTLATTPINNGDTVLFYRGSGAAATTLTLAGGVFELKGQKSYTGIKAGRYCFCGYPWPIAFKLNNLVKCQGKPKGAASFGANCDNVWVWDKEANSGLGQWAKYYYHITKKGYCLKGSTTVTDLEIPAGEGFLFYRGSGAVDETITFSGPDYVAPAQ